MAERDLKPLLSFQGYGNTSAPLWFLGFEEGLGQRHANEGWSPEWELGIRSTWRPVMDARAASATIGERYWEGNRRDYSSVWRNAARLALGILGDGETWCDREAWHRYVVDHLGREGDETLLGEGMPLPAKGLTSWPYSDLYADREAYVTDQWPLRRDLWRGLLTQFKPRFLICYGRGSSDAQWELYSELLGSKEPLSSRWVRTRFENTRVYLMPFLGQGRCRTSDLAEVIADARAQVHSEEKLVGR